MVRHQPLQVYEKQIFLSIITGIYGCRWKRYQRSQDDSSKWECLWFTILCSSFFLLLFWTYFWLVAQNDFNDFNWSVYNRTGEWTDETIPIVASTTVGISYITFLVILALFHISLGQQLNLFWVHKIGVLATLVTTISGVVSVDDIWGDEWEILFISLQATAPFLHIGALATVTAMGWLVAGYILPVALSVRFPDDGSGGVHHHPGCSVLGSALVYLPCVMDRHSLKPRPEIIGRRGAPMMAPENTMLSFNRALQQGATSLEAEVTISVDGVPFLMRDRTLRRTTDVRKVFPSRQYEDASFFNWTEIHTLNAGQWFLESDPYWTVATITPKDRVRIENQTVCSLLDMLRLAARANASALLNIRKPSAQHPRARSWFMDTLRAVLSRLTRPLCSGQVMWSPDTDRGRVRGFQQSTQEKLSVQEMRQRGITSLTLHYSKASHKDIQEYLANNVSVTVYPVNEAWLYSTLWCSGVPSVSSDAPTQGHDLSPFTLPVYFLYAFHCPLLKCHLALDCLNRWKMSEIQSCNPEQIVLNVVTRPQTREVNIMKEKLLFSGTEH
uniref:Glycerophosphodiester phosphodiesterase domain containing 5a n=1 Tax=Neogobius melanostomus TaxID=47308 RepID=A0A8C6SJ41_9GOBI